MQTIQRWVYYIICLKALVPSLVYKTQSNALQIWKGNLLLNCFRHIVVSHLKFLLVVPKHGINYNNKKDENYLKLQNCCWWIILQCFFLHAIYALHALFITFFCCNFNHISNFHLYFCCKFYGCIVTRNTNCSHGLWKTVLWNLVWKFMRKTQWMIENIYSWV